MLGDVIRFGRLKEDREIRAWKSADRARRSIRAAVWYLTCMRPQGEMAQLAVDREEEEAWQQAEADVFEAVRLRHVCEDCIDGHMEGCPSLEPHENLYDVLWDHQCDGCCPNGCEEAGLVAQATIARAGLIRLIGAKEYERRRLMAKQIAEEGINYDDEAKGLGRRPK